MLSLSSTHATVLPIEILLQTVLHNVINNTYCLAFVLEEKLNFQTTQSFINLFTNGTDYEQFVNKVWKASDQGCSDFIVRMRDTALFMKAFDQAVHLGMVRRGNKRIIIMPWDEYSNWLNILSMKETGFVSNILLVHTATEKESSCVNFVLFTRKFVGPDETSNDPVYLDSWNSCTKEFYKKANLFPHDMSNLYGKTLKVASVPYSPYTLLDLNTTVAPLGRDGTEIRVVDEFCRWVNCTVKIIRNKGEHFGELFENMTGVGLIGDIIEDRADFGIPVYSWYTQFRGLDFSAYSVRSGVTCIAPTPSLELSWDIPLRPFGRYMWLATMLAFIFSIIGTILAQRTSDKAFLTTFAILTGQSRNEAVVSSWRIRCVTVWLIVASLILGNAYDAGLAYTYTLPKNQRPIDTLQDLIDRKMKWGAPDTSWLFSISLSSEPLIKQLIQQFTVLSAEELRKKASEKNMAFIIEQLPSGCLAIGEYITKDVVTEYRLMKEDFYHDFTVVMLRKSSPYTTKISDFILRLHETGLMLAFESQVAYKYLDYTVQLGIKMSQSMKKRNVQPLYMDQVAGAFYFYIVGVGVSVFTLFMEMLWKRIRIKQNK